MPFPVAIDYRSVGVFFNVTNTTGWLPKPVQWSITDEAHGTYPGDAMWWLPDVDVSDVIITASSCVAEAWYHKFACMHCNIWRYLTYQPARI